MAFKSGQVKQAKGYADCKRFHVQYVFAAKPRYYQDATIRAASEKVLRWEQNRQPARVLLSLATGSGKTVIAANLLWRLHEAGRLNKPALFLSGRDELREQAEVDAIQTAAREQLSGIESLPARLLARAFGEP